MVSGLPRTLQRPQGLQRSAKTKFFFGAGTIIHMKSTMSPWSRSEQRRRAKRAVVASCFKKYDHFERLRDWMSATDREKAIIISLFPVGNMIFMPEVKDRP